MKYEEVHYGECKIQPFVTSPFPWISSLTARMALGILKIAKVVNCMGSGWSGQVKIIIPGNLSQNMPDQLTKPSKVGL